MKNLSFVYVYRLTSLVVIAGLIVGSGSGCTSSSSSPLDHTFGKTRSDEPSTPSECIVQDSGSSGYLEMIFDRLTSSNPNTFSGIYDPSKICLKLVLDNVPNAVVLRGYPKVHVNSGLILLAETDAEVAATLAHELAHVTTVSNHYEIHQIYPQLLQNEQYTALQKAVHDLSSSLPLAMSARDSAGEALEAMAGGIISGLRGDAEASYRVVEAQLQQLSEQQQAITAKLDRDRKSMEADKSLTSEQRAKKYSEAIAAAQAERASLRDKEVAVEAALNNILFQAAVAAGRGEALRQAKADLEARQNAVTEITAKLEQAKTSLPALADSILGAGTDRIWREQQADEIGFELYMRAGFDPALYESLFISLMDKADARSIQQCRGMLDQIRRGEDVMEPEKLSANPRQNHPNSCWRVWNIRHNEMNGRNREMYASILRQLHDEGKEPIAILKPGALAALQSTLRSQLLP